LREALARVMRLESGIFQNSIKLYLRDLYDHTHQVIDKADYLREIVTNLQETYTAELNNKTNHVIRVLTIISTIFMPLTFIVGVYGMNFRNMPELEWTNGYYYCLAFMGVVFLFFLYYFKRKKWL
jgi:magnesium transporter